MTIQSKLSLLIALMAVVPTTALAQNTSPGTAVHMLIGQSPMRVNLATGSADRYYDFPVITNRSYCVEATEADDELDAADPALTIYHADGATPVGSNDNTTIEPKGLVAARVCFIASADETNFIKLSPSAPAFENQDYALRVVESTLFTNWFFVGGDYSSFTLIRNTTSTAVNYRAMWRNAGGTVVYSQALSAVPPNGIVALNARTINAVLAAGSGSVEIAHDGSPEALVGSQTTLSGGTGLSFDTIYFQRRAW